MYEQFNLHKENGLSFKILLVMIIFIFFSQVYPFIIHLDNFNYEFLLNFLKAGLTTIIVLIPAYLYEQKNKSFTSHLILFSFFLNFYILDLFRSLSINNPIELVIFIVGLIFAIYSLLKLFVHKDELIVVNNTSNRNIDIVILISLFKVFLDNSFSTAAIYALIYLAVIFSLRKSDTLILSLSIYFISLVSNLHLLFLNASSGFNIYFQIFISIVINIIMIAFIFNIYRNNTNYYNEYTN